MQYPVFQEIPYVDPLSRFEQIDSKNAVWLDSSQNHSHLGQYSYIAFEPLQIYKLKSGLLNSKPLTDNPDKIIQTLLRENALQKIPNIPPFQGGLAGFFSYDFAWYLEDLPSQAIDDMGFEDFYLGIYDLVISFDHQQKKSWVVSAGGLTMRSEARHDMARQRLDEALSKLNPDNLAIRETKKNLSTSSYPIDSTHDAMSYEQMVAKTIDYIYAGDIFEANVTQRFKTRFDGDFLDLYQRLRRNNPAPFSALCAFEDTQLLSSSPERFVKVESNKVETRPIKGTAHRSDDWQQDQWLAKQLFESEKDRAENIMIVDLMRNDLSKVCKPHSVKVPSLCQVESYQTVHHLVSIVQGELKEDCDAVDLLTASFPGGSITGAPKLRAMEIIDTLEPYQRGPYCGSIGYLAFNGDMDLSISIRTLCLKNHQLTFGAGGAITADSKAQGEYQESQVKAKALIQTLLE